MKNEEIIRRLENINRSIVPKNKEFIEDSKAIMLAIEAVKAAGRYKVVTVQKIGSTKKDRILKEISKATRLFKFSRSRPNGRSTRLSHCSVGLPPLLLLSALPPSLLTAAVSCGPASFPVPAAGPCVFSFIMSDDI